MFRSNLSFVSWKLALARRSFLLTLAWLGILIGGLGPMFAQVSLEIAPSSSTVAPSETFTITVQVTSGTAQSVDDVAAYLEFDPTVLQINTLTPLGAAAGLPTETVAPSFDNVLGQIDYGVSAEGPPPMAPFDLLTIEFEAIAAGDVVLSFASTAPRSSDASLSGSSVLTGTVSASIRSQLCVACGNPGLNAFGRDFVGDPITAPPTGSGFSRSGGTAFTNLSASISGTTPGSDEESLFQEEIFGSTFSYSVAAQNGSYEVTLYLAEIFHGQNNGNENPGERIFDVSMEGTRFLDEYDLLDPAKDGVAVSATAITRTYFVEITDGTFDLQMGPTTQDNAKLSGFCLIPSPTANLSPEADIGPLSADALVPAAIGLNITDPESDPLTVTLDGLPASLSYNATAGQIEGTPLATDAGTYLVYAIISDGNSAAITEQFTLAINPPPSDDPPVIAPIDDVNVAEGATATVALSITDDNNVFNPSIVLFDKSDGGSNNPITPTTVIPASEYTLIDNGGGNYTLSWPTSPGEGRSYLARVTTDDGVNPAVTQDFSINVAMPFDGNLLARTFASPLPWYGGGPQAPFTVSIETTPAQNLGWVNSGEFVEYVIDVPVAGTYDLVFYCGKGNGGTHTVTFSEEDGIGGFTNLGSIDVTQNGWQNYQPNPVSLTFSRAGVQTLRFDFSGNGGVNIRDFDVSPATPFLVWGEFEAELLPSREVALRWNTLDEMNHAYFEVERRAEEGEYAAIAQIDGQGQPASYHFVDGNILQGKAYYRLKQVDFDGQFTYSEVRVVRTDASGTFQAYPNPLVDQLTLELPALEGSYTLIWQDVMGRPVARQVFEAVPGQPSQRIAVPELTAGNYQLQLLHQSGRIYRTRVVKTK